MLEAVPTIPFQLPLPRPATVLPLSNACSSPRLGMKQTKSKMLGERRKAKRLERRGKKDKKKKSLCAKKKIKICRLSFIIITFFFCTEKHLMGSRACVLGGEQEPRSQPLAGPLGRLIPMK